MILSPGRRYVFIHIPKTGGTAMTLALERHAMPGDIILGDSPGARAQKPTAPKLGKHAPLRAVAPLVADWQGFLVFTLVRNPWDRMVSYYHWLRAQRFGHPAVRRAQTLTFSEFLNHPATLAAQRANPARSYVTEPSGRAGPALFLRVEHLAQDLPPLSRHLGFTPDLPLVNASARARDWRPYYSAADRVMLAQVLADDIAQFGYRFDPD